jgi:hypothetical protein
MVKALLTGLLFCSIGCAAALAESGKRCNPANPSYAAKVAACRVEIEETCLLNLDNTPRADCPALVECRKWKAEECK